MCISSILVICALAAAEEAPAPEGAVLPVREPLRLASGEPMVAVYFFPHWWEPWKSDDDAVLADLARLRAMGVNTLLIDHEASQAIDGDFKYLDRGHRLAKQTGMQIVPWLSLKTWSDMTSEARGAWSRERYGAAVDVTDQGYLPYGDGTIAFGVKYAGEYLNRYAKDGALLHVRRDGTACPVVALTVEASWRREASLDDETRRRFQAWLREKYGSVEALNAAWATAFAEFEEIDPADDAVFDYAVAADTAARALPKPVSDHIDFRAEIVSDALAQQRARLRETFPNLLIMAEIPYHFADEHPHAWGYTVEHGSITKMVGYADMVLLRSSGVLTARARRAVGDYIDRTGKPVVMTYRISPSQGPGDPRIADEDAAPLYAHEAAAFCNGIGYYSWNEMVDVHVAMHHESTAPKDTFVKVDAANHERLCRRMHAINHAYLEIYEKGLPAVLVPPAAGTETGIDVLY